MGNQLSTAQRNAVSRISGLVLTNAMIFQEILAEHEERVLPLQRMLAKQPVLDQVCTHWQFILEQIWALRIESRKKHLCPCDTQDDACIYIGEGFLDEGGETSRGRLVVDTED